MLTLKIPTNIRSVFTLFYTNISLYSTFSTRIILNALLFFTRILLSVVLPPPSFVDTKLYQTVNVKMLATSSLPSQLTIKGLRSVFTFHACSCCVILSFMSTMNFCLCRSEVTLFQPC